MKSTLKSLTICLLTGIMTIVSCSENQLIEKDQLTLEETVSFIKSSENYAEVQYYQAKAYEELKYLHNNLDASQKTLLNSLSEQYEMNQLDYNNYISELKNLDINLVSVLSSSFATKNREARIDLVRELIEVTNPDIAFEALRIVFIDINFKQSNERSMCGYEHCLNQASYVYSQEIYTCIYIGVSGLSTDTCLLIAEIHHFAATMRCFECLAP